MASYHGGGPRQLDEIQRALHDGRHAHIRYPRDVIWQVDQFMGHFRNHFAVEFATYYNEDGSGQELVRLKGTIPCRMNSDGKEWNYPLEIWITDCFPDIPPLVYVDPAPGMKINDKNRIIDASTSRVVHPELNVDWNRQTTSLLQVGIELQRAFGDIAPVYAPVVDTGPAHGRSPSYPGPQSYSGSQSGSQPHPGLQSYPGSQSYPANPGPPAQTYVAPPAQSGYNPYAAPSSSSLFSDMAPTTPYNPYEQRPATIADLPRAASSTPSVRGQPGAAPPYAAVTSDRRYGAAGGPGPRSEFAGAEPIVHPSKPVRVDSIDPSILKTSAVDVANRLLVHTYAAQHSAAKERLAAPQITKRDLEIGAQSLRDMLASLDRSQHQVETALEWYQHALPKIEGSVAELEEQLDGGVDVDSVVEPTSKLDNQIMELIAENSAIDDAMGQFHDLLEQTDDCANLIKLYRAHARDQFMVRATLKKAREQAKPPS